MLQCEPGCRAAASTSVVMTGRAWRWGQDMCGWERERSEEGSSRNVAIQSKVTILLLQTGDQTEILGSTDNSNLPAGGWRNFFFIDWLIDSITHQGLCSADDQNTFMCGGRSSYDIMCNDCCIAGWDFVQAFEGVGEVIWGVGGINRRTLLKISQCTFCSRLPHDTRRSESRQTAPPSPDATQQKLVGNDWREGKRYKTCWYPIIFIIMCLCLSVYFLCSN